MKKRYLFPEDYMADPSVHVFNGRVYIYPSHDWECENVENDNGDQYVMKDYHVLSTDDIMNGQKIVYETNNFLVFLPNMPHIPREDGGHLVITTKEKIFLSTHTP